MLKSLSFIALLLVGCTRFDPDRHVSLEDLRMDVFGDSRQLVYTNKTSGFLLTETNADRRTDRQGWYVMSRKIMDDYLLSIDGRELAKSSVHLARVSPHQFQRAYPAGVQETVTLLDSVDAILIELSVVKGASVAIRPLLPDSAAFIVRPHGDLVLIAREDHLERTPQADFPVWIGVTVSGAEPIVDQTVLRKGTSSGPAAVQAEILHGAAVAVLVAGDTEAETMERAKHISAHAEQLVEQRKQRMQSVLDEAALHLGDSRLDLAVQWALISMDALISQRPTTAIVPGIPDFVQTKARDAFWSLPGATLVQGNFRQAKEILQSFAELQDSNPASRTYGRIPQLPGATPVSYTAADVTPKFVQALGEYVNHSGDTAFARTMYPVIRRAVEGALKRADRYALLTHGDAETWMDAAGPKGSLTPRGNRAVEIQALWYQQLLISSWIAGLVDDTRSFREWFSYAEQVRLSFNRLFLINDSLLVADHLKPDGSPDVRLRPNLLLAMDMIDDPTIRFAVFKSGTERLVYPHGVASLVQDDPEAELFAETPSGNFNGMVWPWLSGPWIHSAAQLGYIQMASVLTDGLVHRILDGTTIGTLPEVLEAGPHTSGLEPRPGGASSHARSLAEFLRVLYEDYLGVAVDAVENRLELAPHLPPSVSNAAFTVFIGRHRVRVRYHSTDSEGAIRLFSQAGAPAIDVVVTWRLSGDVEHNFAYTLAPLTDAEFSITQDGVFVADPNGERKLQMNVVRTVEPDSARVPLSFATPVLRPEKSVRAGQ